MTSPAWWPFAETVFVLDPWLLALLALAAWGWRRGRRRVAAWALVAALGWVLLLVGLRGLARWVVRRDLLGGASNGALVAGGPRFTAPPHPANPFDRRVTVDTGDRVIHATARLRPWGSGVEVGRE